MKKLINWLRIKLGIDSLVTTTESLIDAIGQCNRRLNTIEDAIRANNGRLHTIESLVQIGADINFKTPSWVVVCLRGYKGQDVVRFFELPDGEIGHLYEELKYLEKQFHIHPVFDAPPYIKKEYFKI